MFWKKKSDQDLMNEKKMLENKIRAASAKARAVAERRKVMAEVSKRKDALKKLQAIKEDSLYRNIKAKTSPKIRAAEGAIKRAAPKIMKGLVALGEGSAKATQGMTSGGYWGSTPKKKKKESYPKLW